MAGRGSENRRSNCDFLAKPVSALNSDASDDPFNSLSGIEQLLVVTVYEQRLLQFRSFSVNPFGSLQVNVRDC